MRPNSFLRTRYWDKIANTLAKGQPFDELLAEQYRLVHLNLLNRWSTFPSTSTILKTDLFAEALCPSRAFTWDILNKGNSLVGIDCSPNIVNLARANTLDRTQSSSAQYVVSDLRQLPFADNSFDLIISDSSLDHFDKKAEAGLALRELSRILKRGGTLIITMDNKGNFTEPLFRLWIYLGLSSFFIGPSYTMKELNRMLNMAGLRVVSNTAIIHNPRFFTKILVSLLRKIHPTIFDKLIRNCLGSLDSLEKSKLKYCTAQFIAAQAVKPLST